MQGLQWFLDLLNANLEKESDVEIFDRLYGAAIRFEWTPAGSEPVNVPVPDEVHQDFRTAGQARKALQTLQATLAEFLDTVLSGAPVEVGMYAVSLQFRKMLKPNESHCASFEMPVQVPGKGSGSKVKRVWIPAAKWSLASALRDLPADLPHNAIDRCQECGNLFLRLSRKPKVFCNAKCTSIALSRKRRGEAGTRKRARYNQEMRAYMKGTYRHKGKVD